ncbi:MAG: ABC transporter ATP-binding protein [Myxococcota bacterium]
MVFRDLSLEIASGCTGLLGPNGAGKTTLLRSIVGLVPLYRGSVQVLGRDVTTDSFAIRAQVGFMPEGDSIMPDLSALEFVSLAAELVGIPRKEAKGRAHQVLSYCGLGEARYRKLGTYSVGMKQRVRLAQALVGDPRLLLLDEPTTGFDPRGRDEMLALIADIAKRTGASVILSTHILPDVEKICDQAVVLVEGRVRYSGDLQSMLQPQMNVFEVRLRDSYAEMKAALEARGLVVGLRKSTLEVQLPEDGSAQVILEVAAKHRIPLRHLAPLTQNLEHAFFQMLEGNSQPPLTKVGLN